MRIIVIGAVAGGTSAAAKARRNDETAEITVYEKGRYISYSGCGMPYHLGGVVENGEDLAPRNPEYFRSRYNVRIRTEHEVLKINKDRNKIEVKDLSTGKIFTDSFDRLILATGAEAVIPPIKGVERDHVFTLRNMADMYRIRSFMDERSPRNAVIVGSGFIGLEMAENFQKRGIKVTLVEMLDQVAPGLDQDMAQLVEDHLYEKGVRVIKGSRAQEIGEKSVILSGGEKPMADMVILATGVKPSISLTEGAGIELGVTGAIKVDPYLETTRKGVYAAGDCMEQFHSLTGKSVWMPLGSTANKTGRIAGNNAAGGDLPFRGVLGTSIFRVFDLTVAQTGLSEKEALAEGIDVSVSHNIKPHRSEYMGAEEMTIKSVADRESGRLMGVQIVGRAGVDKRVDVFVSLITFGAKVDDLAHLDLAYAPPYSTSRDPVIYTGMIQENAIMGSRPLLTAGDLLKIEASGEAVTLIDTRTEDQFAADHLPGAVNIPHKEIRGKLKGLNRDSTIVTYCNKGVTGNAVQSILLSSGFKKVYNLSGGHRICGVKNKGGKKD